MTIEETDNNFALPLSEYGPSVSITTKEELAGILKAEQDAWSWLTKSTSPQKQVISQVANACLTVLASALKPVIDSWDEEPESQKAQLLQQLQSMPFPFSGSALGKYILSSMNDSDLTAALLLYLVCTPRAEAPPAAVKRYRDVAASNPFNTFLQRNSSELLYANRLLADFSNRTSPLAREADIQAVSQLSNEIAVMRDETAAESKRHDQWLNDKEEEHDNWVNDNGERYLSRGRKVLREIIRKASDTQKKAEEKLKASIDAFDSQVEFKETVKYWEEKESTHGTRSGEWSKRLAWSVSSIILIPLVISLLPAAWLSDGEIKLLFGVIHPVKLTLILLSVSISSYVTRICSRQYATHQHLMLEAAERQTMLKTYVALMLNNKLKEAEDRKIALEAAFRPAHTGIVDDPGGVTPSDTVIRIFEKQGQ